MLANASQLESGAALETDICIVGAGSAGITLALELARMGRSVLLIEGGGATVKHSDVDRYKGEIISKGGHPALHRHRRAGIGGTTAIWGGRCVPYDPIDFEARAYIPDSGWPIPYEAVAKHYAKATTWCEAGSNEYQIEPALGSVAAPMLPGFQSEAIRTDSIERFSCPTHFGKRYASDLKGEQNLRILYNATCTAIKLNQSGTHVDYLILLTRGGKKISARASAYVLAGGGMESTRLLLASNEIHKKGIGNGHDRLGRYYMTHLGAVVGNLKITSALSPVLFDYERTTEGVYCRRRISISEPAQRAKAMGNVIARLSHPNARNANHGSAVLSMLFLSKGLLQPEYRAALGGNLLVDRAVRGSVLDHLKNVLADLPGTLKFAGRIGVARFLARRKLPSVTLKSRSNEYPLDIDVEQSPLYDSRVRLTNERDGYGMPRLCVNWQYADFDRQTAVKFLRLLKTEVAKSRCGVFDFDEDNIDLSAIGGHHIGTTRMARSEKEGVVDENLQVFGVNNLFVCSSSVFPTSSHANPTLTIIALAVRLAEHLGRRNSR